MRMNRTLIVTLIATLAAGSAVACGGTTAEPQTQTSAAAVTRAPIGQSTHGMVKVLGEALGEVPLRAEQRTELEKIATDADARHAPLAAARKDLMVTLADQVAKGQIDRAVLDAKMTQMRTDAERVRAEDGASLAKVHALLDKDQRAAFADALDARFEKFGHGHHAKGAPHAAHHKGGFAGGFGHMKALADELKLTDEQKEKIFATFKEARAEMRAHWGEKREGAEGAGPDARVRGEGPPKFAQHRRGPKLSDAFRADKLDLTQLGPKAEQHAHMKSMIDRGVSMGEKILPILTPEQRAILAAKIKARADKDPSEVLGAPPPAAE
ncbi:MAG: Spy/CpxP family protein refolding chaperone [Myxococcales bacterium]|nr:Spy/CpxP family protein refolding chaperone [Myxococcales bacterium]